jgi:hypothetical protein
MCFWFFRRAAPVLRLGFDKGADAADLPGEEPEGVVGGNQPAGFACVL